MLIPGMQGEARGAHTTMMADGAPKAVKGSKGKMQNKTGRIRQHEDL